MQGFLIGLAGSSGWWLYPVVIGLVIAALLAGHVVRRRRARHASR